MAEQANTASVEKIFSDLNARNLTANDDLYATGYRQESPGAPEPMTLEQSRENLQGFITAFPDLSFKLRTKVAQGDFVAVSWASSGTHTGPLRTPTGDSIPPTNKKASVNGSSFYEFKNGKIVSSQIYWDMTSLLAQIGMMPGM